MAGILMTYVGRLADYYYNYGNQRYERGLYFDWTMILILIGIALSLPNMVPDAGELSFNYTTSDYLVLLLIIFATVLIMASAVSLLSALAKDVKNAGTMITPFMLVIMLSGLLPIFQDGASDSLVVYLIPFYNSMEVMVSRVRDIGRRP